MILEGIAAYLQGNVDVLTTGSNLFVNTMPAAATQAVLLKATLAGLSINYELPGFNRYAFNVVVRHTEFSAGDSLARQIMTVLTLHDIQLNPEIWVTFLRPKNDPMPYAVSAGGYIEFNVAYEAVLVTP